MNRKSEYRSTIKPADKNPKSERRDNPDKLEGTRNPKKYKSPKAAFGQAHPGPA